MYFILFHLPPSSSIGPSSSSITPLPCLLPIKPTEIEVELYDYIITFRYARHQLNVTQTGINILDAFLLVQNNEISYNFWIFTITKWLKLLIPYESKHLNKTKIFRALPKCDQKRQDNINYPWFFLWLLKCWKYFKCISYIYCTHWFWIPSTNFRCPRTFS